MCSHPFFFSLSLSQVATPCDHVFGGTARGAVRCVTEGTRLTLQTTAAPVGGYYLTIRTPGTPPRWKLFDETLDAVWHELAAAATEGADESASSTGGDGAFITGALAARLGGKRRRVELALSFYFYWINFGPLSRGTSGVGMSILIALLLALDLRLTRQLPHKVQLDWEAILSPSPAAFTGAILEWLNEALQPVEQQMLRSLPLVSATFPTLHTVLAVLGSMEGIEL